MMDLFTGMETGGGAEDPPRKPLAERMRPTTLDEFVGQRHLLGEGKILRRMIESDEVSSLIFWGPPGTGKTTFARIIAERTGADFVFFSAVTSGVKRVREIVERARAAMSLRGRRTILFCDEIHRFNKAQQDAFLPHVEDGTIILIGSTTENPSFEVVAPLLSRTTVLTLKPLTCDELKTIAGRALTDTEKGLGGTGLTLDDRSLDFLVESAGGDARRLLNTLETLALIVKPDESSRMIADREDIEAAVQKSVYLYDRAGEEHYNLVSAMIKSLRGSDPDAALYWCTRMLESGEDPLFIARRLVIFASEDIGLADSEALPLAVAAKEAVQFVGLPEAQLNLAHAVLHLALAPKSNSVLRALLASRDAAEKTRSVPVPLHLRNAPTGLMKDLGYGSGYLYPHDYPGHKVDQDYLPEELRGSVFYSPDGQGMEKIPKERLDELQSGKKREEQD